MSNHFRHWFIVISCFLAPGCFWDTIDDSYATAQEVVDSGSLDRGWIPRWLPEDASQIQETHNLDLNMSELSFLIPERDSLELPAGCAPASYENVVPAYIKRRWWPSEQELHESYAFFRCPSDTANDTFIGIRNDGQRVLHWRVYAR